MSKLLDIVNSPWALPPEKLGEIVAIYSAHVRGEKIDLAAIEARLGEPLANKQPDSYDVIDGVAVIAVEGVLAKRMNMMSRISGGASTELISRDLALALADPRAHSIILAIDSPGGAVDGTQALADQVYAARGVKPIVALADGWMTSAAYWIGSAADEAYISAETAITGSIGVAMQHVDVSRYEEKIGIKTTDIYSGKYKRIASENAPLSEEGRATLQAISDQIYTVFVDQVARNRGVDSATVLQDMADGQLFVGRAAIDAGLVDGVSTLSALIADMQSGVKPAQRSKAPASAAAKPLLIDAAARASEAPGDANPQSHMKGIGMTISKEFLLANHADLVEAFRAEGFARGQIEGRTAGADAERARIQGVEAQALPGHEKLIATLKFDGKTTGPEAAVQVLAAEKATGGAQLAALRDDAGKLNVPAAPSADGDKRNKPAVDENAPIEERCQAKWDSTPAIRAEFDDFKSFLAFEKAMAEGRVKIQGRKAA